MKAKKLISIFMVVVMAVTIFAVNAFAVEVKRLHDEDPYYPFDLYSFSSYDTSCASNFSIITLQSKNYSATVHTQSVVVAYYTDNTTDMDSQIGVREEADYEGDGQGSIARVYYDEEKVVDRFSFQHYFFVNGSCVKRDTYYADYGVDG